MTKSLRGLGRALLGVLALTTGASAQGVPDQSAANPVCARLEGQLAAIDRNAADPVRAEQIKRAEDAVARQQADLDHLIAHAHRVGCAGEGFFSLFSGLSPQCGPLTSQIQQMRGDLDRMMSDLERVKSGGNDREGMRRGVLGQLAQNNCGPQYAAAATAAGPSGFFDALFGGGTIVNPGGDGAPSGTFRTVCVRTCDGYYFPISYSTVPGRFAEDARACQRLCPASEATLYSYRNPGEDMQQAVSVGGQPYTVLPNAFRYRKEMVSGCSCRRPGQSWADALRGADDPTTLQTGDIVVNDPKSRQLPATLQANGGNAPKGAPIQPAANVTPATAAPDSGNATAGNDNGSDPDAKNRKVRTVGPPFIAPQ